MVLGTFSYCTTYFLLRKYCPATTVCLRAVTTLFYFVTTFSRHPHPHPPVVHRTAKFFFRFHTLHYIYVFLLRIEMELFSSNSCHKWENDHTWDDSNILLISAINGKFLTISVPNSTFFLRLPLLLSGILWVCFCLRSKIFFVKLLTLADADAFLTRSCHEWERNLIIEVRR